MHFLRDVTLNYFIIQLALLPAMCSVTCLIPYAHMPSFVFLDTGIHFHDSRPKKLSNWKCLVSLRSYFFLFHLSCYRIGLLLKNLTFPKENSSWRDK